MYEKFKYERIALTLIRLDDRNPRIVTQEKLESEEKIIDFFFENEDLASFIKIIANEGRNPGSERPYVVKDGKNYIVIEGNTRIATYKILTGQAVVSEQYKNLVPSVSQAMRDELVSVDVAIAPSRDALMAIMARAHFGRGDKSRWRYLGSRKAVYDDWKLGESINNLASIFARSQSQIKDLLVEYLLYLEALKLTWTVSEKEVLLRPSIEFNPPVRFLQTTGHKQKVGVELDKVNVEVKFLDSDSKNKFRHLVKRTVIDDSGPSATASYEEVFADYIAPASNQEATAAQAKSQKHDSKSAGDDSGAETNGSEGANSNSGTGNNSNKQDNSNKLFNYSVKRNDLALRQLMKEAKDLNIKKFPAAGTALLRSVVEIILKLIIEEKNLNPQGKLLDIEGASNLVLGQGKLGADDAKILKEFKAQHINYINLSAHATVSPNHSRLLMARDCIDAFVKRNI